MLSTSRPRKPSTLFLKTSASNQSQGRLLLQVSSVTRFRRLSAAGRPALVSAIASRSGFRKVSEIVLSWFDFSQFNYLPLWGFSPITSATSASKVRIFFLKLWSILHWNCHTPLLKFDDWSDCCVFITWQLSQRTSALQACISTSAQYWLANFWCFLSTIFHNWGNLTTEAKENYKWTWLTILYACVILSVSDIPPVGNYRHLNSFDMSDRATMPKTNYYSFGLSATREQMDKTYNPAN